MKACRRYPSSKLVIPNIRSSRSGAIAPVYIRAASNTGTSPRSCASATASRLFDIYVMLAIGVGAFLLRRRGYEMAPLVLGLVLGPLLDKSLRRGLVLSDGSLLPFFTRPISAGFAVVTLLMILMYVPQFRAAVRRLRAGVAAALRAPFAR